MARISTYSVDLYVTGSDRWIGSDWNDNRITKNFTADAVAEYFNRVSAVDTGQFSWNFIQDQSPNVQPDKTFSLVGYTNENIQVNQLEGILKVSFMTLANTQPGVFIEEQWLDKIILIHVPEEPSQYGLYRVTDVTYSNYFYYLTTVLIDGTPGQIDRNTPAIFGLFSGVSGTSGTSGSSGDRKSVV